MRKFGPRLMYVLFSGRLVRAKHFCHVGIAGPQSQFGRQRDDVPSPVREVLQMISRERSIRSADAWIARDVRIQVVRGTRCRGLAWWWAWFSFLQRTADRRMDNFRLSTLDWRTTVNLTRVICQWSGRRGSREVTSKPFPLEYEVEGGKVSRIWTLRENYVFA